MGCQQSSSKGSDTRSSSPWQEEDTTDCLKEINHEEFLKNPDIYYWRNLPQNVIQRAQKLCHDRSFCSSRMLAPRETLEGVCEQDERALSEMGISRFQIADVLETIQTLFVMEYMKGGRDIDQESFDILDGRYTVRFDCHGGVQSSPFEPIAFRINGGSCIFHVTKNSGGKKKKDKYVYGELLVKMIRYHGFFEGHVSGGGYPGVPTFRVDPQRVVDFFGIQPNVDYSLEYQTYSEWHGGSSHWRHDPNGRDDRYYQELTELLSLGSVELPENAGRAYLSWFSALFCIMDTKVDRRVDLKKLAALPSISDQMDYLIKCRVAKLNTKMGYSSHTKENILKAIEQYETLGRVPVPSLLNLEVLGTLQEGPDLPFRLPNVFGAELKTWGHCRFEIIPIRNNRRLVKWNKSI